MRSSQVDSSREVEFAKLLQALESKTTEIIDLKSRLHKAENDLAEYKRTE